MSGKVVAANIDKLPHALQTFLEAPVTGVININWLGGDGMIAAIIVGLIVGWAYSAMMKAGWTIKLPKQVPPAVSNQFTAMIPAGVILIVTMLIFGAFNNFAHTDFLQCAHVVTNEFYNNFINLTGSGITIGLVIFILIAAKSEQMKSLGKLELVPGIFNINEPFLFGMPIVMNPFLAIPFFLTPIVVAISTYCVIRFGIVPPLNGMAAPWTTPAIISGFLIGGWKMAIWQACTLVISTLIYWPFAKKYDNILLKREQANETK